MITGRSFVSKDPRVVGVHGWCKERYGINHDNIVGLYDMRDKVSYGTSQNWYDISGKGNHFEQKTVGAQAALANFYRDFDGSDFMQQTEVDDETGVTFWPTYPGLTTTATAAKIRLQGLDLTQYAVASGNSTHRLVLKDSAGAVISWGYIRGADSAEATTVDINADGTAAFFSTINAPWTHNAGTDMWDIDGTQVGNAFLIKNPGVVIGKYYKVTYTIKNYVAGNVGMSLSNGAWVTARSANGTYTDYGIATINTAIYIKADTDFNGSIDDFIVESYDSFGTDGVLINSTPAGGTQSWTGTGSGDPNAPSTLEVYKVLGTTNLTGDMTVLMWVKPDDGQPASDNALVCRVDPTIRSMYHFLRTSGKVSVDLKLGETARQTITDAAVFTNGAQASFRMIGFSFDAGTSVKIWNNGAEEASTSDGAILASLIDTWESLKIGLDNVTWGDYFNGQIALYMVIEAALTATEIANIAKAIDLNSF